MADYLHTAIAGFRDAMLTALARLEFQLRDTPVSSRQYSSNIHTDDYESSQTPFEIAKLTNLVSQLSMRIVSLEEKLVEPRHTRDDSIADELLTMHPVPNTRNILVASVRSTPALAAAVAAAAPVPQLDLAFTAGDSESESESELDSEMSESTIEVVEETTDDADVECVEEVEAEVEPDIVETESDTDSSGPDLKPIKIKGKPYYIDEEQNVYAETDDGYEQIGIYDATTKSIRVPQEESEEEDDAIEVEDFVYKGTTYQRDTENNVYYDGESIGTWNGKRIVPA